MVFCKWANKTLCNTSFHSFSKDESGPHIGIRKENWKLLEKNTFHKRKKRVKETQEHREETGTVLFRSPNHKCHLQRPWRELTNQKYCVKRQELFLGD